MTKHTPGPWEMLPRTGSLMEYIAIRGQREPGKLRKVCTVESTNPHLLNANARLIAAAPELLSACEAVWRFLYEEPTARTLQEQMQMQATLQAAIAKAHGAELPSSILF